MLHIKKGTTALTCKSHFDCKRDLQTPTMLGQLGSVSGQVRGVEAWKLEQTHWSRPDRYLHLLLGCWLDGTVGEFSIFSRTRKNVRGQIWPNIRLTLVVIGIAGVGVVGKVMWRTHDDTCRSVVRRSCRDSFTVRFTVLLIGDIFVQFQRVFLRWRVAFDFRLTFLTTVFRQELRHHTLTLRSLARRRRWLKLRRVVQLCRRRRWYANRILMRRRRFWRVYLIFTVRGQVGGRIDWRMRLEMLIEIHIIISVHRSSSHTAEAFIHLTTSHFHLHVDLIFPRVRVKVFQMILMHFS